MNFFIYSILIILVLVITFSVIYILYKIYKINNKIIYITSIMSVDKLNNTNDINKDIINKMDNVQLIKFLKERFNLPDYCKMCQRFNPRDNDETMCRFKGKTDYCENGFAEWLLINNNLEGDIDANVN